MYQTPNIISPLTVCAIFLGAVLMIEAHRLARRGAPEGIVERDGSAGAWAVVLGMGLVAAGGVWQAVS